MTEHIVVKAVRDGARFAARRSVAADYPDCTPSSQLVTDTQNVTRTGQVIDGGEARFASWSGSDSIAVEASCDTSGDYSGVFNTGIGAPVVTVRAAVPYVPLFNRIGLSSATLTLHAESQAAVTGE
jgi:hypothetical protein